MSSITFDTLKFSKKLKEAGVPDIQADVQAEAMAELVEERLTTKQDLQMMESELKHEIRTMEMRLTIRLGSMMVVAVGVIAALVKVLS